MVRPMDELAVRRAADAHIQAVASGDVEEAVGYLFGKDVGQARANLARVAEVVTSAEVEDVSIRGARSDRPVPRRDVRSGSSARATRDLLGGSRRTAPAPLG